MKPYTEGDQRADTAFLVGVTHGRDTALAPILALAAQWEGWAEGRSTPRIDAFRDAAEAIRAAIAAAGDTP